MTAPLRRVTTELQSHFGDKGVNKAGATAQTTKLSSLVIREQAGATRQTRRHRGDFSRSSAAAAGRPGWTAASLLRPQLLCPWTALMDAQAAVHRAPDRCRHVVAPLLHKDREEARGAYKRSWCTTLRGGSNTFYSWSSYLRAREKKTVVSLPLYAPLPQQCLRQARCTVTSTSSNTDRQDVAVLPPQEGREPGYAPCLSLP